MMLNKKDFIKGVQILKKTYLSWTFDLNDNMQIALWYERFQALDSEAYMRIIKKFCEESFYAPASPNDILKVLVDEAVAKELSPEAAFQLVRDLIHEHGWKYGSGDIYAAIADKPGLTKTVKEFESELRELRVDDAYTPQRFCRAYQVNVRAEAIHARNVALTGALQIKGESA